MEFIQSKMINDSLMVDKVNKVINCALPNQTYLGFEQGEEAFIQTNSIKLEKIIENQKSVIGVMASAKDIKGKVIQFVTIQKEALKNLIDLV